MNRYQQIKKIEFHQVITIMTDWVSNRLLLTGVQSELERVWQTCLRPSRQNLSGQNHFDFAGLVAEPIELLKQCDQGVCDDLRRWRRANWGVSKNSVNCEILSKQHGVLDIYFETAWTTPSAAFAMLAAQFPQVTGMVFAVEEGSEWGILGTLRDGVYECSTGAISWELRCLTNECISNVMVKLVQESEIPVLPVPAGRGGELDDRVVEVWSRLATLIPDYMRRLNVLCDVRRLNEWHECCEGRTIGNVIKAKLFSNPLTEIFLQGNGRSFSAIDRGVMDLVARLAVADERLPAEIESRLLSELDLLLNWQDEDALWEWTQSAFFRPGITLDLSSTTRLSKSLLRYAVDLHGQLEAHFAALEAAIPPAGVLRVSKPPA